MEKAEKKETTTDRPYLFDIPYTATIEDALKISAQQLYLSLQANKVMKIPEVPKTKNQEEWKRIKIFDFKSK